MPKVFEVLADDLGARATEVGCALPLPVMRMAAALPPLDGPRIVVPPAVVRDAGTGYVGDADGHLLGTPGVRVQRMMTATLA